MQVKKFMDLNSNRINFVINSIPLTLYPAPPLFYIKIAMMKLNLQVRLLVTFRKCCFPLFPLFATTWYVNDGSLSGDVFTTAIGNDTNPGTAASPFASIQFAISSAATSVPCM